MLWITLVLHIFPLSLIVAAVEKLLLATMNCRRSFFNPENLQFEFVAIYSRIVKRLIEASGTRNWLQHLSLRQDLTNGFIVIDQITYRKAWLFYIADKKSLQDENPEIWNYFI